MADNMNRAWLAAMRPCPRFKALNRLVVRGFNKTNGHGRRRWKARHQMWVSMRMQVSVAAHAGGGGGGGGGLGGSGGAGGGGGLGMTQL